MTLSACSTTPTTTIEVTPPKKPVLQQNLVSECPDLPKLTKEWYSQGEVVDILSEWISMYRQCQYKHSETVKFIEEYIEQK